MSRRAGRLLVAALLGVLLGGCGVDTQSRPERIDATTVPSAPTPTVTVVPDPATTPPPTSPAPPVIVPAVTATRPAPPATPG